MDHNDKRIGLLWAIMIFVLILLLFIEINSVTIGQTPAPSNNRPNLTGTVYYSDGKIHAPSNWKVYLYNNTWLFNQTDIKGTYSFSNLSPGEYELLIYNSTGRITYDNKNFTVPNTPYPITFDPVTS